MNPGTTAGILARMPIDFLPNLCYNTVLTTNSFKAQYEVCAD
jgi:hypothetical protein